MTQRTPDATRQALEDMLRSDGWEVFESHMAIAWGAEAFERSVDQELEKNGDPMNEVAVTRRIRDTFKGVRASLKWPEEQIRKLKDGTPVEPKGFERFMRRPGRG
jgi:hypothetical protein